jgi:hypothetical protein
MSRILGQLAVAIGGVFFVVALIVGTVRGVPLTTALFRALIVMSVVSVAVATFFRYFSKVLYRFAAEQVMRHRSAKSPRPAANGGRLPEAAERSPNS